jgi:DNA-binding transcriptional regulator YiaG
MRTSTHTNKGRPLTPEELTAWRERLGLKRQRLAELLGLGESRAAYNTVQRWETGIHHPPAYLRLALAELERQLAARGSVTSEEE